MKIDEDTTLDDSLPEEHAYTISLYDENSLDTFARDYSAEPEQNVAAIKKRYSHLPWFAEIANFLSAEKEDVELTGNEKRKFLRDAKHYFWDEPFLYRHCKDGVFQQCVSEDEILGIMYYIHCSSYPGHFAAFKTVSKILQAGLWWSTMFFDAQAFISKCNSCQRQGNISKRNEMPQNFILEIEVFDCGELSSWDHSHLPTRTRTF